MSTAATTTVSAGAPKLPRRGLALHGREHLADILRLADIFVLLVAAWLAYGIRHIEVDWSAMYVTASVGGILIYLVAGHLIGLYKPSSFTRWNTMLMRLVIALFAMTAGLAIAMFYTKMGATYSRGWVMLWGGVGMLMLILSRVLMRRHIERQFQAGQYQRRVAVVQIGDADITSTLDQLNRLPTRQLQVRHTLSSSAVAGINYSKSLERFLPEARQKEVTDVILVGDLNHAQVPEILLGLQTLPVSVQHALPTNLTASNVDGALYWGELQLIRLFPRPLEGRQLMYKRCEDILLAGCAVVLLSPAFAALALAIKLTSPGPIFFKQKRHGFGGEEFDVLKFRSMIPEEHQPKVKDGFIPQATADDPRVTKIGKFIRRTSLDELPQLLNVLRGEMSLVGPRPHAVSHNEYYDKLITGYAIRNRLKPGITGWAQVKGWRGETDTLEKMEQRVRHDTYYVHNWSLWFDLKILLRTFLIVLKRTNAY